MPIPGPHVHQQLISAYHQTAAKLERIRGELGQIEVQREKLEDDREHTLTKLATYYLPDLTPESIQETWAEIRPTMREILLRKQNRVREYEADLQDQNRIRSHLEDELVRLNTRLDEAEKQQQEIADQVEKALRENPQFIELSQHASMAEAALERAEANLDEISQDAARKLPAYQSCRLFNYLLDRHYGTPKYEHKGVNRRMDRWIAKLVDYPQSKRNYDYLTTTPATMRTVIAEDRLALDTVLDELDRHRDEAAQQCGLLSQIQTAESLRQERESIVTQLDQASRQCETTQSELTRLEAPQCEFHAEAISVFRNMLAQSTSDDLRQEARRTPEITDDQIVASLRGIETEMTRTDRTTDECDERLRLGQEVYEAVGRLTQRFRASGYDRGNCQFSESLDVAGFVDRARNAADIEDLWQSIRRLQSWGPTTMDKITSVATHPMTQVMINAMAHAAAGAMSDHARRAGQRGSRNRRGW
ncbi:hypothetical protein [Neorhodopirellula pilleata]|uniref:Chromosome partition protein Smc n=1 Tax=Neorhodopirellula pilleata TaxID=2714738 RepID=A0A5C6AR24_9BACT|nr:hypothetical protein [Neorhodopirellula pilleata]TWU01921.1 hypothetical protein Pla100_16570 [Neorhodopirellula pilleata]